MLEMRFDEIYYCEAKCYTDRVEIEIKNSKGTKIVLDLDKGDAEYITESLEECLYKQTFNDMKGYLEDKIAELQEEIRMLREENAELRLQRVV